MDFQPQKSSLLSLAKWTAPQKYIYIIVAYKLVAAPAYIPRHAVITEATLTGCRGSLFVQDALLFSFNEMVREVSGKQTLNQWVLSDCGSASL